MPAQTPAMMRPLRGRTRVEGVDGEVIVSSSVLVGGDSHDDGCVPCCLLGMSLSGTSTRPPGARTTSGPAADRPRGPDCVLLCLGALRGARLRHRLVADLGQPV